MNKEELLNEARKRFPIGTIFLSPYTNNRLTVLENNHVYWKNVITVSTDFGNGTHVKNGATVYGEDVGWAKIIFRPNFLKLFKIL